MGGYSLGSMSETTSSTSSAATAATAAQAPAKADPRGRARKSARKPVRPVHPLLQTLWQLHPTLFGARFKPLKVGIFEDLVARHPEAFAREDLKQALAQHVRSTRYLEAVAQGEDRHDLDGQPVEPVAPEHVQHAIAEVFRRKQGRDAAAARAWALARLDQAIEASGLDREAWLERVPTRDATVLGLIDEAYAERAAQAARREALLRAFRASGQSVDAFAEMYGLPVDQVRDALARDAAGTAHVAASTTTG